MSDVIKLLPGHIANQIAAGEVVQRPASVVKELIENSIDAGATKIMLIAKDGGKTLVQVVDNGSGMSDTDARMSFERHATSKIEKADDLFALQTKGFRGEALASIAAIAHVSMKSKQHEAELGTEIIIEGSKIVSQEAVMCTDGTSIAVKNLFFNVPARRNFLASNIAEYRKVLDEFFRIALVHPELELIFHHDDEEIFNVRPANIRQRIVQLFGSSFNQRLVPVNEETDIVKISGFVTKPEYCKTKTDQCYLFVNQRYFKDRYLNHAILSAYDGLIPSGKYPPYFIYFEVPTSSIDVNVHPTKTEIKFEENQAIYAFLRSSIKQALGHFNVSPTLDFEQENSFNIAPLKKGEQVKMPEIKVNPDFNPFKSNPETGGNLSHQRKNTGSGQFSQGSLSPKRDEWENFYGEKKNESEVSHKEETYSSSIDDDIKVEKKKPVQINEKYILSTVKNGIILIDQYRAHLRVIFDEIIENSTQPEVQKIMFEEKIELDKADLPIWKEILEQINQLGFEVSLAKDEVIISGQPMLSKGKNPVGLLREMVEGYKLSEQNKELDIRDKLALALAKTMAIKGGKVLNTEEMENLIDRLFASSSPQYSPQGKKIIESITMDEITKRFN
ncbi:MAG: DNA mismatch repair endonuclease MutL [Crocinitomicaceae bacterium]